MALILTKEEWERLRPAITKDIVTGLPSFSILDLFRAKPELRRPYGKRTDFFLNEPSPFTKKTRTP